ncbi:transposase [Legionella sp. CNM-1927-20]|uniref:transposase n=1 Tax=Legionella sp. CNM-1927-20 TaxID=3422221 RepID=UPI00403B2441
MGKRYKHLTELDRGFISLLLAKGYTKSKRATLLKVHRSTIYREIKRNSFASTWADNKPYYLAEVAHKRYLKRRKRQTKLDGNKPLRSYVHEKLSIGWSPWQAEFGHWEGDLMMFKRGIKGNLLRLRERKTRYLIAIKNENKTAKATALALSSTVSLDLA